MNRDAVIREINFIGVPVTVFDVLASGEFCVFAVNQAAERFAGLAGKDVAGHLLDYIVPADTALRLSDVLRRCVSACTPVESDQKLAIDGESHDVHLACVPVVDGGSRVTNVVVTFCTAGRGDVAQPDDVDRVDSGEFERRRLASELHDVALQKLALVNLKLSQLKSTGLDATAIPALDETIGMIDQTMRDTRALVEELSPFVLADLGLAGAIEWLADRLQSETGILCSVRDDDLPKQLLPQLEIVLFQSVRELLWNVRKHAEARRVRIVCKADADTVSIEVEDDGVGFAPEPVLGDTSADAGTSGTYGLRNLSDRIARLGGAVTIDSAPGLGTHAVLMVPADRAPGGRG